MGYFKPKRLKADNNIILNGMYISTATIEDSEWMLEYMNTKFMKEEYPRMVIQRYNNIVFN